MKWKLGIALGIAVSGMLVAMRLQSHKAAAEADLWSEATDSVFRS